LAYIFTYQLRVTVIGSPETGEDCARQKSHRNVFLSWRLSSMPCWQKRVHMYPAKVSN